MDVCIPGMTELHRPAPTEVQSAHPQNDFHEEVLHLPANAANPPDAGYVTGHSPAGPLSRNSAAVFSTLSARGPAKNYTAVGKAANELALSYLVTYSRLLGEIVHLFHRSIHVRRITSNSIEDITFQVHCWWNRLPAALQDDAHDSTTSYSVTFNMLYNYLILVVNRPFLSLPPDLRQIPVELAGCDNCEPQYHHVFEATYERLLSHGVAGHTLCHLDGRVNSFLCQSTGVVSGLKGRVVSKLFVH